MGDIFKSADECKTRDEYLSQFATPSAIMLVCTQLIHKGINKPTKDDLLSLVEKVSYSTRYYLKEANGVPATNDDLVEVLGYVHRAALKEMEVLKNEN